VLSPAELSSGSSSISTAETLETVEVTLQMLNLTDDASSLAGQMEGIALLACPNRTTATCTAALSDVAARRALTLERGRVPHEGVGQRELGRTSPHAAGSPSIIGGAHGSSRRQLRSERVVKLVLHRTTFDGATLSNRSSVSTALTAELEELPVVPPIFCGGVACGGGAEVNIEFSVPTAISAMVQVTQITSAATTPLSTSALTPVVASELGVSVDLLIVSVITTYPPFPPLPAPPPPSAPPAPPPTPQMPPAALTLVGDETNGAAAAIAVSCAASFALLLLLLALIYRTRRARRGRHQGQPSQAKPSQRQEEDKRSQAKSTQPKQSKAKQSQEAKPSQAKSSKAKQSKAKASQEKRSSQANSSQAKPKQAEPAKSDAENINLPIGTRVQLDGLTGKVEMNGRAGRIEKEFDDVNQRYTVRLELFKTLMLVRPANLCRLEEPLENERAPTATSPDDSPIDSPSGPPPDSLISSRLAPPDSLTIPPVVPSLGELGTPMAPEEAPALQVSSRSSNKPTTEPITGELTPSRSEASRRRAEALARHFQPVVPSLGELGTPPVAPQEASQVSSRSSNKPTTEPTGGLTPSRSEASRRRAHALARHLPPPPALCTLPDPLVLEVMQGAYTARAVSHEQFHTLLPELAGACTSRARLVPDLRKEWAPEAEPSTTVAPHAEPPPRPCCSEAVDFEEVSFRFSGRVEAEDEPSPSLPTSNPSPIAKHLPRLAIPMLAEQEPRPGSKGQGAGTRPPAEHEPRPAESSDGAATPQMSPTTPPACAPPWTTAPTPSPPLRMPLSSRGVPASPARPPPALPPSPRLAQPLSARGMPPLSARQMKEDAGVPASPARPPPALPPSPRLAQPLTGRGMPHGVAELEAEGANRTAGTEQQAESQAVDAARAAPMSTGISDDASFTTKSGKAVLYYA